MTELEDLLAQTIKYPSGCWVLPGHNPRQYSNLVLSGKHQPAHRWVYEQFYGPVDRRYVVHHMCRRVRCLNPDHLKIVTRQQHGILHGFGRR
jgi:hypothetical protein